MGSNREVTRLIHACARAFFPLDLGSSWTYRVIEKVQNRTETFTDLAVGQVRAGTRQAAGEVVSEYSGPDGNGRSTNAYVVEGGYLTRVLGLGGRNQILFEEKGFLPQLLKPM